MRLEQYLGNSGDITYDQYCTGIDIVFGANEGIIDKLKDSSVRAITSAFVDTKVELENISKEFGIGVAQFVQALKNRDIFGLFKAIGFNMRALFKGVNAFTGLVHKGLLNVFKEIHDTGLFQKLKSGVIKFDDLMDQYPILRKVTGPVVAGLLFYIWLNMTFIGHLDYDFDFTDITKSLKGDYTLSELFASPQGLLLTTLFTTGSIISAPWLGKTAYNLLLAIIYTAFKLTTSSDHDILKRIRMKIKTARA